MAKSELLTRRQAAAILNMRPQTLAVWGMSGKYLPYVRVGRTVRYRLSDIEKLIEQRLVGAGVSETSNDASYEEKLAGATTVDGTHRTATDGGGAS